MKIRGLLTGKPLGINLIARVNFRLFIFNRISIIWQAADFDAKNHTLRGKSLSLSIPFKLSCLLLFLYPLYSWSVSGHVCPYERYDLRTYVLKLERWDWSIRMPEAFKPPKAVILNLFFLIRTSTSMSIEYIIFQLKTLLFPFFHTLFFSRSPNVFVKCCD